MVLAAVVIVVFLVTLLVSAHGRRLWVSPKMLHPHVDAAIDDHEHEQEDEEEGDDDDDYHPGKSHGNLQWRIRNLPQSFWSIPPSEKPKAKQSNPKKVPFKKEMQVMA